MNTVRITKCDEYTNRFRNIHIIIDGKTAGTIANGETKDFDAAPWNSGNHLLYHVRCQ